MDFIVHVIEKALGFLLAIITILCLLGGFEVGKTSLQRSRQGLPPRNWIEGVSHLLYKLFLKYLERK